MAVVVVVVVGVWVWVWVWAWAWGGGVDVGVCGEVVGQEARNGGAGVQQRGERAEDAFGC